MKGGEVDSGEGDGGEEIGMRIGGEVERVAAVHHSGATQAGDVVSGAPDGPTTGEGEEVEAIVSESEAGK